MKKVWMWSGALFAAGVSAGLAGGAPRAAGPAPAPAPAVAAAIDESEALCAGGLEGSLAAELIAESVQDGPGGQLTARLQLTSRFAGRAAAAWTLELVDDRGRALVRPRVDAPRRIAGAGELRSDRFTTPRGLRDGYYQLRATAAASDGDEDAADIATLYFAVQRGAIELLDSDDYLARSAANLAVQP